MYEVEWKEFKFTGILEEHIENYLNEKARQGYKLIATQILNADGRIARFIWEKKEE